MRGGHEAVAPGHQVVDDIVVQIFPKELARLPAQVIAARPLGPRQHRAAAEKGGRTAQGEIGPAPRQAEGPELAQGAGQSAAGVLVGQVLREAGRLLEGGGRAVGQGQPAPAAGQTDGVHGVGPEVDPRVVGRCAPAGHGKGLSPPLPGNGAAPPSAARSP